MKDKFVLISFFILTGIFCAKAQQENEPSEWKIRFKKPVDVEAIKGVYYHRTTRKKIAYINKTGFRNLKEKGVAFTILETNIRPRKNAYQVSSNPGKAPLDSYPSYSAYESMMASYAQQNTAICRLDTFRTLPSGRRLLVLMITDNPDSLEKEPDFLYTSTMHGDETGGYILMLNLIDTLLNSYGQNPRLTSLVDNTRIFINPLANPDGTYAGGNSNISMATRFNGNGIDLNRNFPDPKGGAHPDGNVWQPETQAFMALAERYTFQMSANIHSGVEVVNYPWDTWNHHHPIEDWWQMVSREFADTAQAYSPSGYLQSNQFPNGITRGYEWYSIEGGRQDYMNYFQYTREFSLELSNTKITPANELVDLWDYNRRSLLNYMQQATYGVSGKVYDSLTGKPLRAKVTVAAFDKDSSHVYSRKEDGYYHRYFKAAKRELTFQAPGYKTKKDTVNIQDYALKSKDVALKKKGSWIRQETQNAGVIYPNPAAEKMKIKFVPQLNGKKIHLRVLNMQGKMLVKKAFYNAPDKFQLTLTDLPPGMYLLKVRCEQRTYQNKFIKL